MRVCHRTAILNLFISASSVLESFGHFVPLGMAAVLETAVADTVVAHHVLVAAGEEVKGKSLEILAMG